MNLLSLIKKRNKPRIRITPLASPALLRTWLHLNRLVPPGHLLLPQVPLGYFLEVEGTEIPELGEPVALVLLNLEGWPLLVVLERPVLGIEALLGEVGLEWVLLDGAEAALERLFPSSVEVPPPVVVDLPPPPAEEAPPPTEPTPEPSPEPTPEPPKAESSPTQSPREAAWESFAREFWSGETSWSKLYQRHLQSIKEQAEHKASLLQERKNSPPPPHPDTPLCPLCKNPMQLKTARHGRNAGKQFWSCTRFPNCKGTRPFEEPAS